MIIQLLSNMIGLVAAVGLIVAAIVYMVSPKQGGEILKRLAVFTVGALIGICLLRQFAACVGPLLFLLFGVLITFAAYFIREARRSHPQREKSRQSAERTPLLPPDKEDA